MFFSIPPITRVLIGIHIAAFILELGDGGVLVAYFALWPIGAGDILGFPSFQPWQLITYSFFHGSPTHLLFNMFALYMFGSELERLFGGRSYIILYFVSVIVAALAQLMVSGVLQSEPYPTIGASGGIFGLLLAYAVYFPNRTILLLFPPIPMPARMFVLLYGGLELFLGVTGTAAGVAHFAHLGGMFGAWLLIRYWRGRSPFRRH